MYLCIEHFALPSVSTLLQPHKTAALIGFHR